ncbi:hypothetical protein KAH27_05780 [bacterium]|nr:hypothetical protein [bacterium]
MKKLLIAAPYKIGYEDVTDEPLTPSSIRIRSLFNGISHGTEMNFFRGMAPQLKNNIDGGLFQKRKTDDNPFPVWHGYETVGEVIEMIRKKALEFGADYVIDPTQGNVAEQNF